VSAPTNPAGAPDAITVEVVSQSMAGIVQEMQNSLFATGYSVVIRESHDASCAITDAEGRVVAQHTVLPLHLGAFPGCVEGVLAAHPVASMAPGDAFVINHPYLGGSPHASDMAIISPIFVDGRVFGFAGAMAHKPDIGGLVPGSNSGQAREIFHEGIMVPPVRLYRRGELVTEVEEILAANSRSPELLIGDLHGQVGAATLGVERVQKLCARLGADAVAGATQRLFDITERHVRVAVASWPDGVYEGEAALHNDAVESGRPVKVRVRATIAGDQAHFDFRETDPQTSGPYNIRHHLVRAVCYYALKCLVNPDLPSNHGLSAAIQTEFREGTVVSPISPAPVNSYMPIALATAEAIFAALAPAVPAARIAFSSHGGTTVTGTLSYPRKGKPAQVQYEILAGAMGARGDRDGVSATSVHVRNASLTPIEIVESEFPVVVQRFEVVRDSGGPGRFRGGLGMGREYRMIGPARRTARGGQDLGAPQGRDGGESGRPPRALVRTADGAPDRVLGGADINVDFTAGDVFRVEMGGAGGLGDSFTRPADEVLGDVFEGYVSPEAAATDYGVVLVPDGRRWRVDEAATAELRARPGG
jgi:N-methylhydantoinase B